MSIGTVKWFNASKGYGFIQPEDGGKDVFVHVTAVEAAGMRGLAEGQRVEYEATPDQRSGKVSAEKLRAI
jgi:CspA family cold shock protein